MQLFKINIYRVCMYHEIKAFEMDKCLGIYFRIICLLYAFYERIFFLIHE